MQAQHPPKWTTRLDQQVLLHRIKYLVCRCGAELGLEEIDFSTSVSYTHLTLPTNREV